MPQIPIYDAPKVQPQPLQAPSLQAQAPNLGAAVGQGMQSAASVIEQANERANHLRAEDAYTKLQMAAQSLNQEALSKTGIDAIRGTGDAAEAPSQEFPRRLQDAADSLKADLNPQQQAMFDRMAQRTFVEQHGLLTAHEREQVKVYKDSVATGAVAAEADAAYRDPYNEQSAKLGQGRVAILVDETTKGLAPELRQAILTEKIGTIAARRLDGLIEAKDYRAAQDALESHKLTMPPEVAKAYGMKLQHLQENATMNNEVDAAAANAATAYAKPNDWDQALKDMTTGSVFQSLTPEAQHTARAMFHERRTSWEQQRHADTETLAGQAVMAYAQGGYKMNALLQSDAFSSLQQADPQKASHLRDYVIERARAAAAPWPVSPAQQVAMYATYQKFLDDPASLMGLSDAQIASYMPTLGPDLTNHLMDAKRKAMGALDALKANTLNDLPFKDIAAEYGLKVKGTMTPEDNAKLGMLRDRTLEAIRSEQVATGKPLGVDRKEEILRRQLIQVPTKMAGDWFSHDRFLFQVGSFMDLKGTDAEKMLAVDYLTRADAPINAANVQTMLDAIRKKGDLVKTSPAGTAIVTGATK